MVNKMKTIFLAFISLMFLGSGLAYAGEGPYTKSAHGNTIYGVDRTGTSQYARGHCAHCHEQHASIAGTEPDPKTGDAEGPDKFCLLANNFDTTATLGAYDQDDNACFYCHCNATNTLQDPVFSNYSYSRTFGGYTSDTTASIMEAFNLASYHNLKDVIDYAAATWTTFTTDNNPCCACHNPHLAKRNKENPGNPSYTAISKPSAHEELWGDDATEGMDDYSYTYQAPYWYGGSPTYFEPYSTNTTQDGSNLPNYAAFCLDCHVNAIPKSMGVPATINAINWVTTDQHGQAAAAHTSSEGSLIDPYDDASSGIYALSCTDCHEPHGSSNEWLLRTEVNAKKGISITNPGVWYEFCTACHVVNLTSGSHTSLTSSSNCSGSSCHKHGDKF